MSRTIYPRPRRLRAEPLNFFRKAGRLEPLPYTKDHTGKCIDCGGITLDGPHYLEENDLGWILEYECMECRACWRETPMEAPPDIKRSRATVTG